MTVVYALMLTILQAQQPAAQAHTAAHAQKLAEVHGRAGCARSRRFFCRRDRRTRRHEYRSRAGGVPAAERPRPRTLRRAASEVPHHRTGRRGTIRRARPIRSHGAVQASGTFISLDRGDAGRAVSYDAGSPAAAERWRDLRGRLRDQRAERRAAHARRSGAGVSRRRRARQPIRERAQRDGRGRQDSPVRSGDDGERARSAADWRVESERGPEESDVPVQPGPFLGRRSQPHESHHSTRARTDRSAWCGSTFRKNTTDCTARRNRPRSGVPNRTAACG